MVTFRDHHIADQVINASNNEPLMIGGVPLTLRYGSLTRLNQPSKTLFLTNYRLEDTEGLEERLETLFAPYANIVRVRTSA